MVFGDLEDKVAKYKVCSPVTELGRLLMILVLLFHQAQLKALGEAVSDGEEEEEDSDEEDEDDEEDDAKSEDANGAKT